MSFNKSYGWISPTYQEAIRAYEFISTILKGAIVCKNRSSLYLELEDGSAINFFSSENYDTIRGRAFNLVVVEKYNAMLVNYLLKPMLICSRGEIIVLGDVL